MMTNKANCWLSVKKNSGGLSSGDNKWVGWGGYEWERNPRDIDRNQLGNKHISGLSLQLPSTRRWFLLYDSRLASHANSKLKFIYVKRVSFSLHSMLIMLFASACRGGGRRKRGWWGAVGWFWSPDWLWRIESSCKGINNAFPFNSSKHIQIISIYLHSKTLF